MDEREIDGGLLVERANAPEIDGGLLVERANAPFECRKCSHS